MQTKVETPAMEAYGRLLSGNLKATVTLTEDEQAAIIQAYDYGADALCAEDAHHIATAIAKLKDVIWP